MTEMYLSGMSNFQIAKDLGMNPATVYSNLKKAGVKMRTKKEAHAKYAKMDNCIICEKEFRVREDWLHGNHYRKTCSPECEKAYRSQRIKETYTDERRDYMSELFTGRDTTGWNISKGKDRANWKGGISSPCFRKIALGELGLEEVCSSCGSKENLCVHHKDKNRTNNTVENLLILCKPCHTSHHNRSGDCGFANNDYNQNKNSKENLE